MQKRPALAPAFLLWFILSAISGWRKNPVRQIVADKIMAKKAPFFQNC